MASRGNFVLNNEWIRTWTISPKQKSTGNKYEEMVV